VNIFFKTGENYYSGFQKFNILDDRTFRGCLIAFVILIALHIPAIIALPTGPYRECYFILVFLAYMLPAALVLAGGMPAAGWLWYAATAAFYAAATIPVALGASYFFLLLLLPALLCFVMVDRITPGLLAALGYKAPAKPATEITFTILTAAVLIAYTWMVQALIGKGGFRIMPVEKYLWFLATSVLYYGTLWGILHGLFMRRFLDMRYENVVPIALNAILMSLYWIASVLGYSAASLQFLIGGAILMGIASQVTLGLAFYFCKSARPLLAAYAIYYLFLKSAVILQGHS
jgi:hypothetical protein